MSDLEFDVLDELYFVQPFDHLISELELEKSDLKEILKSMLDKGWIKCFRTMSDEVFPEDLDFENKYADYFYLATKKGLLTHNSI